MNNDNGRLCTDSDFFFKSPICDYNPLFNPYDSSSGIDKNPFELKENFNNIKRINNPYNIIFCVLFIILLVLLVYKK